MARLNTSMEVLKLFQEDTDDFMQRIVTQDETWISYFDSETKAESLY